MKHLCEENHKALLKDETEILYICQDILYEILRRFILTQISNLLFFSNFNESIQNSVRFFPSLWKLGATLGISCREIHMWKYPRKFWKQKDWDWGIVIYKVIKNVKKINVQKCKHILSKPVISKRNILLQLKRAGGESIVSVYRWSQERTDD